MLKSATHSAVKSTRQKTIHAVVLLAISVAAGLTGIILLLWPYGPLVHYWLFPPEPDMSSTVFFDAFHATNGLPIDDPENRLLIPKIQVDARIWEGEDISVLSEKDGVWHEPMTKTPDKRGNTVIAGHRFQYLPGNPNTLYLLDKMAIGDPITVHWEGREYRYQVKKIFEVLPTQTEIRHSRKARELTIYTCTPIGSTARRLVVKAQLL